LQRRLERTICVRTIQPHKPLDILIAHQSQDARRAQTRVVTSPFRAPNSVRSSRTFKTKRSNADSIEAAASCASLT
jgi:hypothetical protein